MIKIGVTGGIGSGKSTLCKLFAQKGIPHYDTDAKAKELMLSNGDLKLLIIELFGAEAYQDGMLNRTLLAAKIFKDTSLREKLNSIVHPAVRVDFWAWCEKHEKAGEVPYILVESAILFNAGFNEQLDRTIAVVAPERLKVERVMARDGINEEQVLLRLAAQMNDDELHEKADITVANIFEEDLEGSVLRLDQIFKKMALDKENANKP